MKTNPLGLEYITLLGAHPLHFIETAAAVGCTHVSLFPEHVPHSPEGSPPFSLIDDAKLRRDVVSCLDAYAVTIGLVDRFAVLEGESVEQYRRWLDVMGELGVSRINTVSRDPDPERTLEETARLVSMAAEYGLTVTTEPCPALSVKTLAEGLELIAAVAMPNFKLLIDTMHVSRTGEALMVPAVDPVLVDYVQICDGRRAMPATSEDYLDEARNERMIPGDGEFPLAEMLRTLRPEVIVSTEVPLRARREAGMSDLARARLAVDGTLRVLGISGQATA